MVRPDPLTGLPISIFNTPMNWKKISRTLSLIAVGIGGIGFAGWVFRIDAFKRIHPALVTMKANTALCLMLAGAAVALLRDENVSGFRRRVAQAFAVIIATVGLLTLGEHLGWWATGIDQALFSESLAEAGRSFPGRMNPPSTLNFMLLGLAILLIDSRPRRGPWPAQVCAAGVIAITFLIFLIYFYNVEIPQSLRIYLSIALHTVVAFFLLAAAILLARPERGIIAVFLADNTGGIIARRLLPSALLLPALIGWLCVLGRDAGYYGRGVGTALLATSLTVIFTILVWWAARELATAAARRRRAEEKLLRSERDLSDFFDNAAVSLHWVGPDGTVLRVNDTELALVGYARDEYLGHHIAEFHADAPVIADILARLSAGETLADYPARLRCKDGSLRDVVIHSSVYWEDGKFIHTRCFTRDVTELKRAEKATVAARDAAEAASRAKDEFLAVLSHELRTPLTPVLLLSAAMERSDELPPEVRRDFGTIRKNVELEARIIDDLLDLTRITQGKLVLRVESVDPHHLVEHALEILRSEIDAKKITVAVDLTAGDHHVSGDAVRLQQVFWNILKNSVKFTPPEGRISISSRSAGGRLCIAITDTGLGITPEEMPRIFVSFGQGDEAAEPRFGGLGLGLSISSVLVREHSGRIWAESPGREQGATFHVELPLAPAPEFAASGTALPPVAPQPLRILLVEDHDATRATLGRLLARRGHEIADANCVAQALALAGPDRFDIVISDLGLPDGHGHDLMRALHRDFGLTGIALSGYGMEADIRRSKEAGFGEHLTKPVDLADLEAAMQRIVAAHNDR